LIPFSDSPARRRRIPIVMPLIVVANILVFVYQISLPAGEDRFLLSYGAIPFEITHGIDIPPTISLPIYATLLTSMFIHQGILHLGGNLLFLWVFGDNVEDRLGHLTFLFFYLACGLIAGLAQIAIDVNSRVPAIGASGAISGVLGAYLVLFPHSQVRTLLFLGPFFTITRISAIFLIGFWIVTQLAAGFFLVELGNAQAGGVAYFAHIGGFVAGLILILFLRPQQ